MKIKDILGEDDATPMKVKSISGDQVDIDQGGTDIKAKVTDLIANPDKPGEFQMKPPPTTGQGAVQPGSTITTSEEYEDDEHPETAKHFHDWIHSEHSPHSDEAGDDNKVHMKAVHFLHSRGVHPGDIEYHAAHMAHKFHGSDIDETHNDLISQGNNDVGGDATTNYINQVRDQDFEQAQGHGAEMEEDFKDLLGLNKTPEEWAKTSTQMATLLQFQKKYQGTAYADQIAKRIALLKDRLDIAGTEVAGPAGTPKPVVPPEQFNTNELKEADDALLEKMRMIAGLR